jgi:hypothetical protein
MNGKPKKTSRADTAEAKREKNENRKFLRDVLLSWQMISIKKLRTDSHLSSNDSVQIH